MKKIIFILLPCILLLSFLEAGQRLRYAVRFHNIYWLKYGFVDRPENYEKLMDKVIRDIQVPVVKYDGYYKLNPKNKSVYHINSHGFRGKEFGEKNKYRIIILGGSSTFGIDARDGFTYPDLLQKYLGDKYEVINCGISAAGIFHIKNLFEKEIISYKPDLIIINSTANDIAGLKNVNTRDMSILQGINQFLLGKSVFYMTLREKIASIMTGSIDDVYGNNVSGILREFKKSDKLFNNIAKAYEDIIILAKKNNIKVVLITQPVVPKKKYIMFDEKLKPIWDRAYRTTREVCYKNNVQLIDMAEYINALPNRDELFTDGVHTTEKGNEYIANKIKDELRLSQ